MATIGHDEVKEIPLLEIGAFRRIKVDGLRSVHFFTKIESQRRFEVAGEGLLQDKSLNARSQLLLGCVRLCAGDFEPRTRPCFLELRDVTQLAPFFGTRLLLLQCTNLLFFD